ncbi:MAG: methylenetetrahydrofolate reductase [Candidatus Heimdallarchaeota archaeon]
MTSISVELEPPRGIYDVNQERLASIEGELDEYSNKVDLVSITNRPVFGLSAITMAKRVQNYLRKISDNSPRVSVHLTTRLSHFDLFRSVLDAHRMGLTDILPLLGDPRGPSDKNYFENGFDILGFISYLRWGKKQFLSNKYLALLDRGQLVRPIPDATFSIGSVVDVNPYKIRKNISKFTIGDKQVRFARLKESNGAEYLISQGLYESKYYFDFIDNCDLSIPVIQGIIPARLRLINQFGIPIHPLKKSRLRSAFTTREEHEIGNKIAADVYQELIDGGCKQVHIYSLGNFNNFREITDFSSSNGKLKKVKGNNVDSNSEKLLNKKNNGE